MQMLEPLMRLMGKQVHTPVCHVRHLWPFFVSTSLSLYIPAGIAHLLEHMAFKGEQQVPFMCRSAKLAKLISVVCTVCHSAYILQAALALGQKIMPKKLLSLEPLTRVIAICSA